MDKAIVKEKGFVGALLALSVLLIVAFAMITVVYGLETIASGAHDVFHDFRHTLGFPCH